MCKLKMFYNCFYNCCSNHKSLLHELHSLLRVMWSGRMSTVVSPHNMLYTVWNNIPFFRGYSQQDAQEFLSYVVFAASPCTLCAWSAESFVKNTRILQSVLLGVPAMLAKQGIAFMGVHLCVSVCRVGERILFRNRCNLVGMSVRWTPEMIRFWWHLTFDLELFLYLLDNRIACNLKTTGEILM